MEKVSILIPVFRGSRFLEGILERFVKDDYPKKEIITIISAPTEESLKLVKKFKRKVKFLVSEPRLGKVEALNLGFKKSSGDILFFFDSDNVIPEKSNKMIRSLVSQMKGADVADFPMDSIKEGITTRMAGLEFVNASMSGYMYSKTVKAKPVVIGAALVVRRETFSELGGFRKMISEDGDFGWRAFEKGKKYKQIEGFRVLTETPSNIREWFRQRTRWAVGTAEWFFEHYRSIPKTTIKRAFHITIPSLFILFPMTVLALVGSVLSESTIERVFILSLFLLPFKFPDLTNVAFALISTVTLLKSAVMYMISFGVSSGMTYMASRLLKLDFRMRDFVLYYFVYSYLMLIMFAYGFVRVGMMKSMKISDWKV